MRTKGRSEVWCRWGSAVLAAGMALLAGAQVIGAPIAGRDGRMAALVDDVVTLVALTAGRQDNNAIVLVSGRRGSNCIEHEVNRGWGAVKVTAFGQWNSSSIKCVAELAVLSVDHAMFIQRNPWTNGPDPLTPALQRPLGPTLNIWVVANGADVLKQVDTDTAQASSLYSASRVGVSFGTNGKVTQISPTAPQADIIGDGCYDLALLRGAPPPLYQPDQINIYYVPRIKMGGLFGERGFNCFEYGAPNVIYISLQDYAEVTLAHELGHALGLRGTMGHVTRQRFGSGNIMVGSMDIDVLEGRDRFSLGQAYRMNVEEDSWLNRGSATRVTSWCQDEISAQFPCPLLQAEKNQGKDLP